jgi:hypothetical protein
MWDGVRACSQPVRAGDCPMFRSALAKVLLRVRVRRLFCDNGGCSRRTFAEPLPGLALRYARPTSGLDRVLCAQTSMVIASRRCQPAGAGLRTSGQASVKTTRRGSRPGSRLRRHPTKGRWTRGRGRTSDRGFVPQCGPRQGHMGGGTLRLTVTSKHLAEAARKAVDSLREQLEGHVESTTDTLAERSDVRTVVNPNNEITARHPRGHAAAGPHPRPHLPLHARDLGPHPSRQPLLRDLRR